MVFHIFFPCFCNLIFFPLHFYYLTLLVWWDVAGGYWRFSSVQVEVTSRISHLLCRGWVWPVTPGNELCLCNIRKTRAHSAFPALTVKSHKAKEVWCILRVNVDPMQGRGWRGKRSSSMVPISITVTECEWVLHRQKYLASKYCFEFHKPSSLMDNPLDRRTSYTLESSSAFAASPGSLMS